MAATSFFLDGLVDVLNGDIDLSADTLKLSVVNSGYTFDKTTQFFDTGADDANDPSANLLAATNYADKTVTGTVAAHKITTGDGKVSIVISDASFGVLGGAANDTIAGLILWKDTGTPTTSPVIAYFPVTNPAATSGISVTFDFKSEAEGGNIRYALPSQT